MSAPKPVSINDIASECPDPLDGVLTIDERRFLYHRGFQARAQIRRLLDLLPEDPTPTPQPRDRTP